MPSSIVANPVPLGGAITLAIVATGTMTLSRAVAVGGVPGVYTQLYTGVPTPFYVDVGDMLPGPLVNATTYVYQMVDDNGTLVTPPVAPNLTLAIQPDPLTFLLQRLLQGAVNALYLPNGVKRADVLQAMPIVGLPPLPLITLNLNVLQQREIPIGQSLWTADALGNITISGLVNRIYQISVLSLNGPERDFYRDALVGIFKIITGAVLAPSGQDVTHQFEIASGQVAKDIEGKAPGFYYADAMLEFSGEMNITVSTDYGVAQTIDFSAYTPDGVVTSAVITAV